MYLWWGALSPSSQGSSSLIPKAPGLLGRTGSGPARSLGTGASPFLPLRPESAGGVRHFRLVGALERPSVRSDGEPSQVAGLLHIFAKALLEQDGSRTVRGFLFFDPVQMPVEWENIPGLRDMPQRNVAELETARLELRGPPGPGGQRAWSRPIALAFWPCPRGQRHVRELEGTPEDRYTRECVPSTEEGTETPRDRLGMPTFEFSVPDREAGLGLTLSVRGWTRYVSLAGLLDAAAPREGPAPWEPGGGWGQAQPEGGDRRRGEGRKRGQLGLGERGGLVGRRLGQLDDPGHVRDAGRGGPGGRHGPGGRDGPGGRHGPGGRGRPGDDLGWTPAPHPFDSLPDGVLLGGPAAEGGDGDAGSGDGRDGQPMDVGSDAKSEGIKYVHVLQPMQGVPGSVLGALLTRHLAYHAAVGASGTLAYMAEPLLGEALRDPLVRAAVDSGRLVIVEWDALANVERWGYSAQVVVNNHALLGAWGRRARLLFLDLDEFVAFDRPNLGLREAFAPDGCAGRASVGANGDPSSFGGVEIPRFSAHARPPGDVPGRTRDRAVAVAPAAASRVLLEALEAAGPSAAAAVAGAAALGSGGGARDPPPVAEPTRPPNTTLPYYLSDVSTGEVLARVLARRGKRATWGKALADPEGTANFEVHGGAACAAGRRRPPPVAPERDAGRPVVSRCVRFASFRAAPASCAAILHDENVFRKRADPPPDATVGGSWTWALDRVRDDSVVRVRGSAIGTREA